MRIAYVCADPGVPVFGRKGCSIHVQEVIRALIGQGAEVHLFACRLGADAVPPGLESVVVHRLPKPPRGEPSLREQAALEANEDLRRALEREPPFDLVYERYSLWSFSAMEYAQQAGTPGLLEVNAPLIEEQAQHRGLANRAGAEWVAQQVFAATAQLIAVSREVKTYLEGYREAKGRVQVINNGVNAERFREGLMPTHPAPAATFTVGFVGTLKPWHGLPVLIEAFTRFHQRHPDSRLLIVGDGPQREQLEAQIEAQGLVQAVQLTGAVDPGAIPGLLASMDVGVAPYPSGEGFYFSPLKVFEYMAAGLPVAASRIGQLAELIDHQVNGLLCAPGDASELAETLADLKEDSGLRVRLGRAARALVMREHTWEAVAQRILSLANAGQYQTRQRVEAG